MNIRSLCSVLLLLTAGALPVAAPAQAFAREVPPTFSVDLTCDDGTTFTSTIVNPDQAGGIPSTWRLAPGSGSDARAFTFRGVTVVDPETGESHTFGNVDGIGHHHDLVTCSFTAPETGRLFELTGFFVP